MKKLIVALCASIMLVAPATAQQLVGNLVAYRVTVSESGQESREEAGTGKPGDLLEYVLTYTNPESTPVSNLQVTLPVPGGARFEGHATAPSHATAGGEWAAYPLKETVVSDGAQVERLIPYERYRALRWTLSTLKGGEATEVSMRVRIPSAVQQ